MSFTSPVLQDANNGWTCYGPTNTIIPHIVDLRDMDAPYNSLVVNIAALTEPQVNLFLAIEEPDAVARQNIPKSKWHKYFPPRRFSGWKKSYTEKDLPMFGTIGALYQCYYDYLHITLFRRHQPLAICHRDLAAARSVQRRSGRQPPGARISWLRGLAELAEDHRRHDGRHHRSGRGFYADQDERQTSRPWKTNSGRPTPH